MGCMVTVHLNGPTDENVWSRAKTLARERGTSRSRLVLMLLRRWLREQPDHELPPEWLEDEHA